MFMEVTLNDFPSYDDVQDILREWVWNPKSIVDTTFGIGVGFKDWSFNFHKDKDNIVYIDFYHIEPECAYSIPVWRENMTPQESARYFYNYRDFANTFEREEDWW